MEYSHVDGFEMFRALKDSRIFQTLGAPKVTSAHTTPISAFWTRSGDLRMAAPPTFCATYAMEHAT